MKKLIVLFSLVASISVLQLSSMVMSPVHLQGSADTVRVLVSPELRGLVDRWITEYGHDKPGIVISEADISDEGKGYQLDDNGVIGLVTEDYLRSFKRGSLWSMVVARDVIVPVISADNPFMEEIMAKGISASAFAEIYSVPGTLSWGKILNTENDAAVNCYCLGDESVKLRLSQFSQAEELKANVNLVPDNNELLEGIMHDKYAIGFCRLSGIIDYKNHIVREGLQIVPIDINGNGVLDQNENIYTCLNDFNRGVWIGKYPGSLCRNIHVVSAAAPVDEGKIAFLQWVLSGGQDYISEAGFSELIPGERQPKIQGLIGPGTAVTVGNQQPFSTARIFFIIATVVVAGLLIYIISKLVKAASEKQQAVPVIVSPEAFNEQSVNAPAGIFFDKSHTWAFMEKDGNVKIGIDDFLQHVTGKVTNIKMKQTGVKVKKGEVIVSLIQQGKQLDIHSPVTGVISEYNRDLSGNSSLLNTSPYSDGWIYIVEPENWLKETRKFFMADNYREWLKSEFSRLKDFIAAAVKANELTYSQVILQDGGELRDKLLENFGPDVWEEFQRRYLDPQSF